MKIKFIIGSVGVFADTNLSQIWHQVRVAIGSDAPASPINDFDEFKGYELFAPILGNVRFTTTEKSGLYQLNVSPEHFPFEYAEKKGLEIEREDISVLICGMLCSAGITAIPGEVVDRTN
jgi:hypothetical protein